MEATPPPREGGADGADAEAWAAASAKLLDLAGDLSGAAAAARGRTRETASSLAETLAAAFAVMPAAQVGAILMRKLREESRESSGRRREASVPDSGVAGCFGSGMHDDRGAVVVGGGGDGQAAGSLAGDASAAAEVTGVVACRGEREEGEGVAHAVADACRELVLTCLVGRGDG